MTRNLTTEDFIRKAKAIHGDKYDYSKTVYVNNKTKVKIICKIHGEFEQNPRSHLKGSGCAKCQANVKSPRLLTTETFINRANKIHNNKYDYSKTVYKGAINKVIIVCPEHGEFKKIAAKHLQGSGCPKCMNKNRGIKKCIDKDSFIKLAKEIHGDKYNYDQVEYINSTHKVKIYCKEHGFFEQSPNAHLARHGCPKCRLKALSESQIKDFNDFVKEARLIHKDLYEYDKNTYKNANVRCKIHCNRCNTDFWQTPSKHLYGRGCKRCNAKEASKKQLKPLKQFIQEARLLHGDLYNYDLVEYKGRNSKIYIKCNNCNTIFSILPSAHLCGVGCPECKKTISIGEKKVKRWLQMNEIVFKEQKRFINCKYKNTLAFDFYLPDYNLCIEYQGKQHYKPVPRFGGEEALKEQQIRDEIKRNFCKENDIELLEIKYDENIEEKLQKYFCRHKKI